MKMKTAIVTGANKGIGLATAKKLCEAGINVIGTARSQQNIDHALEHFKKETSISFQLLDLSDANSIKQFTKNISSKYSSIDILVNNAGIHLDGIWAGNNTLEVNRSVLENTFAVNFFGTVELTQQLFPLLMKSTGARIVNISSIMGSMALHIQPDSDIRHVKPFAYDASKTALNQFTIHLAHYLEGTVHAVSSVHPGWVKTDLGGEMAPLETEQGAETGVTLALEPTTTYNGKFMFGNQSLPW